jgi:hypothetical protein
MPWWKLISSLGYVPKTISGRIESPASVSGIVLWEGTTILVISTRTPIFNIEDQLTSEFHIVRQGET